MRTFYIVSETEMKEVGTLPASWLAWYDHLAAAPVFQHRLNKKGLVSEEDFEWVDEYYCTEPGCKIPDRCLHQGKPTLCGQEKKPCDYCEGKGWYINEDHKKYPEVQQKLDCWHCLGSGHTKVAIPKEEKEGEPVENIQICTYPDCPHCAYEEEQEGERIMEEAKTSALIMEWFDKWCEKTKRGGGVLITTSIKELLTDFYNDHF